MNLINDCYRQREAAERLGISIGTLRNWRSKRKGPPYITGARETLYPKEAFDRWVSRNYNVVDPEAEAAI